MKLKQKQGPRTAFKVMVSKVKVTKTIFQKYGENGGGTPIEDSKLSTAVYLSDACFEEPG